MFLILLALVTAVMAQCGPEFPHCHSFYCTPPLGCTICLNGWWNPPRCDQQCSSHCYPNGPLCDQQSGACHICNPADKTWGALCDQPCPAFCKFLPQGSRNWLSSIF